MNMLHEELLEKTLRALKDGARLERVKIQFLRGTARVVTKKELFIGGALYMKRFPSVLQYVKKIFDFHSKRFQSKLFKIEISWIKLFDEETFGKEGWRELEIIRN